MALGGMIGGGIYSAFGLVVAISGEVAWLAWTLAGVIALCAGYSYIKLNEFVDDRGGAPTYIEALAGNRTLAGITGWTLLFGYVGSIALYAYAFSRFFAELFGRLHVLSVPIANVVAVLLVFAFVGLNLVGVSETGKVEDVLTFVKVAIIGVFGVWGIVYATSGHTLALGLDSVANVTPVMGAAMSFVAFQGW
jgi:amino acid transporter